MIEEQKIIFIDTAGLIPAVIEMRDQGYRLVQICCNKLENIELIYSFDKNYEFINLKLSLPANEARVPSISGIFWSAFLYENEIHDLFAITIENMVVDYKGNFYQLSVKTPFNPQILGCKERNNHE